MRKLLLWSLGTRKAHLRTKYPLDRMKDWAPSDKTPWIQRFTVKRFTVLWFYASIHTLYIFNIFNLELIKKKSVWRNSSGFKAFLMKKGMSSWDLPCNRDFWAEGVTEVTVITEQQYRWWHLHGIKYYSSKNTGMIISLNIWGNQDLDTVQGLALGLSASDGGSRTSHISHFKCVIFPTMPFCFLPGGWPSSGVVTKQDRTQRRIWDFIGVPSGILFIFLLSLPHLS